MSKYEMLFLAARIGIGAVVSVGVVGFFAFIVGASGRK